MNVSLQVRAKLIGSCNVGSVSCDPSWFGVCMDADHPLPDGQSTALSSLIHGTYVGGAVQVWVRARHSQNYLVNTGNASPTRYTMVRASSDDHHLHTNRAKSCGLGVHGSL